MLKHGMLAVGLLMALGGCEKKAPPTPEQTRAATAAEKEARALEAAKMREDKAVDKAKEKQEIAKDNLEAAKEKADDTADKVGLDWRGPDDRWSNDWAIFAAGADKSWDKGDYMIERDADGSLTAWRKTQQVSGNAFAEVKDAALATQVKAKLAVDEDTQNRGIAVDAEDHVVHLRGALETPTQAAEAVRIALSTPGTDKVVSHLTWAKTK